MSLLSFIHGPSECKAKLRNYASTTEFKLADNRVSLDNKIGLFTYNNKPEPRLLEWYCRFNNIPITVLAKNFGPWSWYGKIGPLIEALQVSRKEIVFCLDDNDTAILQLPTFSQCIDTLRKYSDRDILFVRGNNWPPKLEYTIANYTFYPSAGGYFGYREPILQCLLEIKKWYDERLATVWYRGKFDDQAAWRLLFFRKQHRLGIDEESIILARYNYVASQLETIKAALSTI